LCHTLITQKIRWKILGRISHNGADDTMNSFTTNPLQTESSKDTIENVAIFFSDTLRYDYLPEQVKRLGISGKMIAPSTGTLQSIPSIMTGQYPERHKLWRKNKKKLDKKPELFNTNPNHGLNAETSWVFFDSSEKPIVKVHRLKRETQLTDL